MKLAPYQKTHRSMALSSLTKAAARMSQTPKVIQFTTDKRFVRRKRELKIIETMVRIYCRGHRHGDGKGLCSDCAALFDYATRRLQRCVFGDAKPTCANCLVHCYTADRREQVRTIMRWSGPRMLLRHPVLAVLHMIDGRRPSPKLPEKPGASAR